MTSNYHRQPNNFRDDIKASFGLPLRVANVGETFDRNNDIWFDGKFIRFRHEFQGQPIKCDGGIQKWHMADALTVYNRATMRAEDFADYYGDDPTECGFCS